jgi:hypothetical protein
MLETAKPGLALHIAGLEPGNFSGFCREICVLMGGVVKGGSGPGLDDGRIGNGGSGTGPGAGRPGEGDGYGRGGASCSGGSGLGISGPLNFIFSRVRTC